jgi:hypothetical protein
MHIPLSRSGRCGGVALASDRIGSRKSKMHDFVQLGASEGSKAARQNPLTVFGITNNNDTTQ